VGVVWSPSLVITCYWLWSNKLVRYYLHWLLVFTISKETMYNIFTSRRWSQCKFDNSLLVGVWRHWPWGRSNVLNAIIANCKRSCRNLFKKLQILPLASQYMLALLKFVVQNKNLFMTNNKNHNLDTRQINNLYRPQAKLTIYQKRAYYSGINFLN